MDRDVEVKMLKFAAIRYSGGRESRFANSRGMLIGDAAGLADPITGEGIYASLHQAQMAADVIFDYFNKRIASITPYDNLLRLTFQAEMIWAERMSTFIYRFPRLSRAMLQIKGQDFLEGFIRVVAGHKTYRQLFNGRSLVAKLWALPSAMLKNRF
jgi:flavin-dependent dehydrogenase